MEYGRKFSKVYLNTKIFARFLKGHWEIDKN